MDLQIDLKKRHVGYAWATLLAAQMSMTLWSKHLYEQDPMIEGEARSFEHAANYLGILISGFETHLTDNNATGHCEVNYTFGRPDPEPS